MSDQSTTVITVGPKSFKDRLLFNARELNSSLSKAIKEKMVCYSVGALGYTLLFSTDHSLLPATVAVGTLLTLETFYNLGTIRGARKNEEERKSKKPSV